MGRGRGNVQAVTCCFNCGGPVTRVLAQADGSACAPVRVFMCRDCDVWEKPFTAQELMRGKAKVCVWDGMEIRYIDHSREHWPSPA